MLEIQILIRLLAGESTSQMASRINGHYVRIRMVQKSIADKFQTTWEEMPSKLQGISFADVVGMYSHTPAKPGKTRENKDDFFFSEFETFLITQFKAGKRLPEIAHITKIDRMMLQKQTEDLYEKLGVGDRKNFLAIVLNNSMEQLTIIARSRTKQRHAFVAALTVTELEIARMACAATSNAEIALTRGITEKTVKFHLTNVYRKLKVPGRIGLVLKRDLLYQQPVKSLEIVEPPLPVGL